MNAIFEKCTCVEFFLRSLFRMQLNLHYMHLLGCTTCAFTCNKCKRIGEIYTKSVFQANQTKTRNNQVKNSMALWNAWFSDISVWSMTEHIQMTTSWVRSRYFRIPFIRKYRHNSASISDREHIIPLHYQELVTPQMASNQKRMCFFYVSFHCALKTMERKMITTLLQTLNCSQNHTRDFYAHWPFRKWLDHSQLKAKKKKRRRIT